MPLSRLIRGPVYRRPRILLYGREKVGKSTFAAGAPSPVIIPIKGEEGVDGQHVAKFPTCHTFGEVMQAIAELTNEDHDFESVVIDSTSSLEPLVWDEAIRQASHHEARTINTIEDIGGGFGKGYIAAAAQWRRLTDALDRLRDARNMTIILIGHCKEKTIYDPEQETYRAWMPDIDDRAMNLLNRWADSILFANFVVAVKADRKARSAKDRRAIGGDERVLCTRRRPTHPGGGREEYGELPYSLPLRFDAYATAVLAARERRAAAAEANGFHESDDNNDDQAADAESVADDEAEAQEHVHGHEHATA